jgi:DNA-binding NarL/FixJ family response regulator
MKALDPLDRETDNLVLENGGRFIVEFRAYPALGRVLIGTLNRLADSPTFRRILADLDAVANNMRSLAANVDFSESSADELGGFIALGDALVLQIEYFLPDSIPFEIRAVLFLRALVAYEAGLLNLLFEDPGKDIATRFLPPGCIALFPPVPKPYRTAAICLATAEMSQRAYFEAQRRGRSHIGRHAADLLALQAVQPERFATRIEEALETATRITQSGLRKRALIGTARARAGADRIKLDDLLRAETFEAGVELAGDRDLIDLTVHPEALNVFPARVASRIVDDTRKAMAAKRDAEIDDEQEPHDLPSREATAENHLYLARLVREMPDRDQKILQLLLKGRTAKEIADALGIHPTAASKAISRLRQRLTS